MIKKIIFTIIINLVFISSVAYWADTPYKDKMNSAKAAYNEAKNSTSWKTYSQQELNSLEQNAKDAKAAYDNSAEAQGDITSDWFTISVDDISPGMWVQWSTTKQNVNYLLGTIIQNLMIALWSLAILIMTIWAWYMLTYYGQDEQLSKWKKIFMSGVYAMITALSAYYIVSIVRYLLYFGDN